jgi:hypothetical protein
VSVLQGLKSVLSFPLRKSGLVVERAQTSDALKRRAAVAVDLVAALTAVPERNRSHNAEAVVFSMDRAMQLDALLGSYVAKVKNPAPLHILYRATTSAHRKAYDQALALYDVVVRDITVQEARTTFRQQLLGIIDQISAPKILFLVDDDVFVEPVDFNTMTSIESRWAIPSLRLGTNLSMTYVLQKKQPHPKFFSWDGVSASKSAEAPSAVGDSDDLLCWRWKDGVFEWAYPLSVDGHFFATAEIAALIRHTEFDSPNTLEGNLQLYADFFMSRLGVCYRKSRLVNVPCNKVQTDNRNIHGDLHQDELLRKWQSGLRIHLESLYGIMNRGAHEDIPLVFRRRETTQ